MNVDSASRYSRQIILPEVGTNGQEALQKSRVIVVGCGATGSTALNLLVRAGVGDVTIIDRDFVERTNLQRQVLFDEDDIDTPKALAAATKVQRANSEVTVHNVIKDLNPSNAEALLSGSDVVVDGTDNMETRFLVNDACTKHQIPWIYSGAVGTHGMVMAILPHSTACLRCFMPNIPPQGVLQTCDLAGVLNTIPAIMASLAVTETFKVIVGATSENASLIIYDAWRQTFQKMGVSKNPSCRCCSHREFEFLNAEQRDKTTTLCGRDAVQITPARDSEIEFEELARNLGRIGEVKRSDHVLMFKDSSAEHEMTLFRDGRAIIRGTKDVDVAKSIYSRYVAK